MPLKAANPPTATEFTATRGCAYRMIVAAVLMPGKMRT